MTFEDRQARIERVARQVTYAVAEAAGIDPGDLLTRLHDALRLVVIGASDLESLAENGSLAVAGGAIGYLGVLEHEEQKSVATDTK